MVAVDLVGQAEHGYNSPAWLYTTDQALCRLCYKKSSRINCRIYLKYHEIMQVLHGVIMVKLFYAIPDEELWLKLVINTLQST